MESTRAAATPGSARGRTEGAGAAFVSVALGVIATAAAFWAGCASGPLGDRPKVDGFICSDPGGSPYRSLIQFTVLLSDADMTKTSARVEYSVGGGPYLPATLVPIGGEPGSISGNVIGGLKLTGVPTSVDFLWDSYADGVATLAASPLETVTVRVVPSDVDGQGDQSTCIIDVSNRFAEFIVPEETVTFDEGLTGVGTVGPEYVSIVNGMDLTLSWDITGVPAWLQVSPGTSGVTTAGTTSIELVADVAGGGLTEGTHSATLTVTGTDQASGEVPQGPRYPLDTYTVAVSIDVRNPEPAIFVHDNAASPGPYEVTALLFECVEDIDTSDSGSFWIENAGETGSLLDWTASDDALDGTPAYDWLSSPTVPLALAPGASQEVTFNVDASGLAAGTYNATITVDGEDDQYVPVEPAPPKTVDVSLWVKTKACIQPFSPGSHDFPYAVAGALYNGGAAATYDVTIRNTGEQDLDWSVTVPAGNPWIASVAPADSTAAGGPLGLYETVTVTISVMPTASETPSSTTYTCDLEFNNLSDAGAPVEYLTANLHVYNAPTLQVSPGTMTFTGVKTLWNPAGQNFNVSYAAGVNLPPFTWQVSNIAYGTGSGWLATNPAVGSYTSASLGLVTANVGIAPLGANTATVTVSSPGAASQNIAVTFNVFDLTWSATGLWHKTNHRSHSGVQSWYYGQETVWDYDTGLANSGTLTTSAMPLGPGNHSLSFYQWRQTENWGAPYDVSTVQILNQVGALQETLYTNYMSTAGWVQAGPYDLSAYANQTIMIRFGFNTVDSGMNNYEGWYVDSIMLDGMKIDGTN